MMFAQFRLRKMHRKLPNLAKSRFCAKKNVTSKPFSSFWSLVACIANDFK